jgi:hypothetical protein
MGNSCDGETTPIFFLRNLMAGVKMRLVTVRQPFNAGIKSESQSESQKHAQSGAVLISGTARSNRR